MRPNTVPTIKPRPSGINNGTTHRPLINADKD